MSTQFSSKSQTKAKPKAVAPKRAAKAKPKPPTQPKQDNPINEGGGMTATQDPPQDTTTPPDAAGSTTSQATPTKTKTPGKYLVAKVLSLDLSDPISLVEQLKSVTQEGQLTQVFVPVGTEEGANHKKAIEKFGSNNDMAGDYKAIAVKGVRDFPNVSTATKRTVSFD